jgi:nitrogenase molybdenum-cofactor synthesis protein NifE
MMVCSKSMINIATKMQQRYGIPYFEGSFYGISDMSETLREIARLLVQQGADAELIERTERLIEVEEARAFKRIAEYKARLTGKRVLLITGGVKSWSVVAALQEGGMEIVGTSVKKSTKEDKEKLKEIMGEGADAHMIDDMTPREMYAMLKDARADIMLSGGRSQFVALKARMPWLDINQERHHAYAGYEGMVELVHQIDRALSNPVWQRVRIVAPWGDDGETLPVVEPSTCTAHLSAVAAHAMGLAPEEIPA